MQTLHLHSLASHIVAWHNRHPLARRIGIQHVQSIGYVMLPFETTASTTAERSATVVLPTEPVAQAQPESADGATLRERAMARALHTPSHAPSHAPAPTPAPPAALPAPKASRSAALPAPLKPAFSEDFIKPLRPAAVAAFALLHGADAATPGKDNPVRMVKPDGGVNLPLLQRRWLLTAQIEADGRRTRLLAGAGRTPALLGQRLWSLPRVSLAVAVPLVMAAVLALGIKALFKPSAVQPASAGPAAVAFAAASAAPPQALTTAVPASAAAPGETVPTATSPGLPSAPASAPAALPDTAQRPTDVNPTWGQVNLPSIGPVADERRLTALAARQAAPALAPPDAGQPPAPAVVAQPAVALSSRLIRTRAESEQIADAVRGLLATGSTARLQVEAMRSGDDWRVDCWPFSSREQADKARALLASRGLKLQVVNF